MRVFTAILDLFTPISTGGREVAIGSAHLNRAALDDLLREATSHRRFESRNQLAQVCGFPPSVLSNALRANRGLSDAVETSLLEHTGWSRDSLYIPQPIPKADLEKKRLLAEVRKLREQVIELVTRGTDDITNAVLKIGD